MRSAPVQRSEFNVPKIRPLLPSLRRGKPPGFAKRTHSGFSCSLCLCGYPENCETKPRCVDSAHSSPRLRVISLLIPESHGRFYQTKPTSNGKDRMNKINRMSDRDFTKRTHSFHAETRRRGGEKMKTGKRERRQIFVGRRALSENYETNPCTRRASSKFQVQGSKPAKVESRKQKMRNEAIS
jgi:hypothetical protein